MIFTKSSLLALFFVVTANAFITGACLAQAQSSKHVIVVTFDYDFTAVPARSEKVTKKCIAKFIVYDISGEKPYKLFTIPVPADANGKVKVISGESQRFSSSLGNTYWECRRRGIAENNRTHMPVRSGRRFRERAG